MSIIAQNIGNKNINRAIKAYVISLIYATSAATIGLIVAYFGKIDDYFILKRWY